MLTPTAKPAGVMGAERHRAAHVSKQFRSVPTPTISPMLNIVTSERLRHVVEASKTALEGGGLGKPTGVRGVQLWRKIGDPPPVNESEFEFVSEFTRRRMTLDYQMSQGGMNVHYQARWVSTRGDTGPWGELVSATVVK